MRRVYRFELLAGTLLATMMFALTPAQPQSNPAM